MGMRSLERSVIKQRCRDKYGNTRNFREEWHKYQNAKRMVRTEQFANDGKITAIRSKPAQKKKQHHYDDGKVMLRRMRAMKEMFANLRKQAEEKKSEKAE